ncbi:MAG: InlB B-repeat-containing protein [Oscillospiraceae bacterium]|nr:InlB B-repeat-containing protein [Oscillospiraceae bacterium]
MKKTSWRCIAAFLGLTMSFNQIPLGAFAQETVEEASMNQAYLEKSGSVVTVRDNESGVTTVRYMYTEQPYEASTWYNYYTTGKQNSTVNTTAGFRSVTGKVNSVTGISSLDLKTIDLSVAGFYTFWINDSSGTHFQYFTVEENDLLVEKPYVTVEGNNLVLHNNSSNLTSANCMYTQDTYTYSTWYNYWKTGQQNTSVNGSAGYRGIKDINAPYECSVPGYYTILMSYGSGLTRTQTVRVNQYKASVTLRTDGILNEITSVYSGKQLALRDGESYIPMTYTGKGVYTASGLGSDSCQLYIKDGSTYTAFPGSAAAVTSGTRNIEVSLYSVTSNTNGAVFSGSPCARSGEVYTAKLTPNTGMQLPAFINVRVDGGTLAFNEYSYDKSTGIVSIPRADGRISITAVAQEKTVPVTITLNTMGGTVYDGSWQDRGNYNYTYNANGLTLLPVPEAPCSSETISFAGWYTDLAYTNKVTSANFSTDTTLYAKWVYSSTSYTSNSMYYAYSATMADVRGYSSGNYIKTTYSNGGYRAFYYYNGNAYPYTANGTNNYGGTAFSFASGTGTSIFKQIGTTGIYYAQVMAVEGSFVTINYVIVNTKTTEIKNFTLGAAADVQIASNDRAAISVGSDANGTYLVMEDGSTYAFRMYTGSGNYWIGGYSSSYCYNGSGFQSNVFNSSSMNSNHYDRKFSNGVDSAMAYNWLNQTIPAKGTIIRTAKLGVGTISQMGKNSSTSVTLSSNGGSFTTGTVYSLSATTKTLSLSGAQIPVRNGYTFTGWNTRSDGSGTAYSQNSSVPSITLYAQWVKDAVPMYTVYNKSLVKDIDGNTLPSATAGILISYDSGLILQGSNASELVNTEADFAATLSITNDSYCLPETITVTVGGVTLREGTDYVYSHYSGDSTMANLLIYRRALTAKVVITAVGTLVPAAAPEITLTNWREAQLRDTVTIPANVVKAANHTYAYQWYMTDNNTNSGGKALAQYTNTLKVTSATTKNAGTYYYYCVVTATRDNGQKAKTVSDVATLVVNKAQLSDITVIVDDHETSLSSNPGGGAVSYEYFTDADCTHKTTSSDGAGLVGGKPSVNGTYYVRALIAESASYYSYTTAPSQYIVNGLPYIEQDSKYATIRNNDSALSTVFYMYTQDIYSYTTWYNFTVTGKLNPSINSSKGYLAVSGTVNGLSSTLDGKTITLDHAGYYTFLMKYRDGKSTQMTILVTENDLLRDLPFVTQQYINDNYAIVDNNNSGVYKISYMYTEDPYTFSTVYNFAVTGKQNIQENTSAGYKTIKGETAPGEGHNITSTLDGSKILMSRAGYYTFVITYGNGKVVANTLHVGNDISEVSSQGMKITYTDELTSGTLTQYSYMYAGDTQPDITGTFTYKANAADNTEIVRSSDQQTEFSFIAQKNGWYIVRVLDDVLGTKFYKVHVEQTQQTGAEKAVLIVNGTNISASMLNDSDIVYVKFSDKTDYVRGNRLKVDNIGIYTVDMIDSDGYNHTLVANILTLNPNDSVDYSKLTSQLTTSQKALTLYQAVDNPQAQTIAGSYVSLSAVQTLKTAIQTAKTQLEDAVTQTDVDNAYKELRTQTNTFTNSVYVINPELVSVNEDTITVSPADQSYSLENVIYNVDDNKSLMPYVIKSWTGLSARPYLSVRNFEDGKLILRNVPNGIYSFYINQNESGSVKTYVRYAVVSSGSDKQTVANSELDRYILQADNSLASCTPQSNAVPGDLYVSDAVYNNLVSRIASAKTMAQALSEDPACKDIDNDIIPELIYLLDALKQVDQSAKTMEAPIENDPVVITVNNDTTVDFASTSVSHAYVAYGRCSNWYQINKSGYTKLTFQNSQARFSNAKYNGTYTALVVYTDGTQEYKNFDISGIEYPFSVTQDNGLINIDFSDNTNVTRVGYGFGEINDKDSKDFYAQNVNAGSSQHTFHAMGNGLHSVYVQYSNGDIYYVTINVDSCTAPAVFELNGNLGVFTNGFDIQYVGYAQGTFRTWNEMYDSAKYVDQNTWFQMNSSGGFTQGSSYTFYFSGTQNSYIVNVTF